MNSRERVLAALNFIETDRIPIHDNPWASTVARWLREGLPSDISPAEFFDYELAVYGADRRPAPPSHGGQPPASLWRAPVSRGGRSAARGLTW